MFNTIDYPYPQIDVPDKVKIMKVKVFNLMPRVNETRFLFQHEPCECKFGLNNIAYNSRQKLNHDKF